MTERSYEDVVALLQRQLGGQLARSRDEGRDEMVRALRDGLGLDAASAREAIAGLERGGQLRYVTAASEGRRDDPDPAPPIVVAPNNTGGGGPPAIPTPSGALPSAGYWEIGSPAADDPIGTRKGQVRPRE